MKQTALFLFFLMFNIALFGQKLPDNTQIKWGNEQKFDKKMTLIEVAAQDETGYYFIKRRLGFSFATEKTLPFLEKYDKNLNLVKGVDFSKYNLPGKPKFEKFLVWNNQLWLFYTTDPENDKEEGLYRIAVDPKTLTLVGESHFILPSSKNSVKPSISVKSLVNIKITKSLFHIFPSSEQGKLLVVHEEPKTEKNQKLIHVLVLDHDFNTVLTKSENIMAQSSNIELVDAILDSNGNVHLLSNDLIDKSIITSRENSYFTLISIPANGSQALHKKLDLANYQIFNARIKANKEGQLYFGGFYTQAKSNRSTGGTYLLKLNGNDQRVLSQEMEEFEESFLTSGLKNRDAKKVSKNLDKGKSVEDASFFLDEIIIKEDGSVALIGEERDSQFRSFQTSNAVPNRHIPTESRNPGLNNNSMNLPVYEFRSIVVAEFDANGKRKWATKIVKDQYSRSDDGIYFSYSVSMINNNLYFIFNDNLKNLGYNGNGKVERFTPIQMKDQMISLVKLDKEGSITRSALSVQNDNNLMTITPVNTQTGPHEMVIYGLRKKTYRLAKLTFDPNMMASE